MGCDQLSFTTIRSFTLFQSTHPHGVRLYLCAIEEPFCCFNPRTHMGCDSFQGGGGLAAECFNPRTHMGCDRHCLNSSATSTRFQSTHPHGVRPAVRYISSYSIPFQSTHPHGVRPRDPTALAAPPSFNPRTHMGCDPATDGEAATHCLFQSTHPHGVRLKACSGFYYLVVSIHAPTWGATIEP